MLTTISRLASSSVSALTRPAPPSQASRRGKASAKRTAPQRKRPAPARKAAPEDDGLQNLTPRE
ncbi:MAG TPA: hypothetical protein VNO70_20170, partial [Blastocatellia bacterium]|nr:hypothetical protein [Blastocatellia bacterium]